VRGAHRRGGATRHRLSLAVAAVALVVGLLVGATACVPPPPTPYRATIERLPADVIRRMSGVSWRPGCPVPLARLRLLRLSYWGFDGKAHIGALVVRDDVAPAVVDIFRRIYNARFPIQRMQLVDDFAGSDDRSMAANNTSAFNCREIDGRPGTWSQHSFGVAVDINPVQNPWVRGSTVDPPAGRAYVDRRNVRPGMILAGDAVTSAFAAHGWGWGGTFRNAKDYQHFSATGR
jgi:D-alanyl-D-alanine carboxypeptidase